MCRDIFAGAQAAEKRVQCNQAAQMQYFPVVRPECSVSPTEWGGVRPHRDRASGCVAIVFHGSQNSGFA